MEADRIMSAEKIEWNPAYDTELRFVDDEHQALVQQLNGLLGTLTAGAAAALWLPSLDALIGHVADHFAHEERVMENIGYAEYIPHRNIHRQLLDEVAHFRQALNPDKPVKDTLAAIHFLKFWLLRHVVQEDSKLKRFVYGGVYGI